MILVTRGYGAGASVPFVVTRGYVPGEAPLTVDGRLLLRRDANRIRGLARSSARTRELVPPARRA